MDARSRVVAFVESNDLQAPPAYRLLDAVSELGEESKAVCTSTEYGDESAALSVPEDELGDALFALLTLYGERDVDAEAALETAISNYDDRLAETGAAGSGE